MDGLVDEIHSYRFYQLPFVIDTCLYRQYVAQWGHELKKKCTFWNFILENDLYIVFYHGEYLYFKDDIP